MRAASLLMAALLMTVLPGCADSEDDGGSSTASSTADATDKCPTVDASSSVPGWTIHGGQWGSVDLLQGHEDVVCGEATAALDHLIAPDGSFTSVNAKVSFNMLAGDSGAGLVVNYKDDQNYVIVRYSIREQGWHLFTMVDGNRQKQDAASVTPPTTNPEVHQWVELTVRHADGKVTAYDGATKVIDYTLAPEASHSGQVGLFLRDAGMVALFDDFTVTA